MYVTKLNRINKQVGQKHFLRVVVVLIGKMEASFYFELGSI